MQGHSSQSASNEMLQTNGRWWDERAALHERSEFYDVQRVIDGEIRLNSYEIEEVGDVVGKNLLHLQCHLGTETIGWARLGAIATGLDFSKDVITQARALAVRSNVDVSYVQSNVYDAPEALAESQFDVVYSNIGSLHWLPNIDLWAETIERLLAPGGKLYVNEIHPVTSVLADDSPTFSRDYFSTEQVVWDESGSYADTDVETVHNEHVIWDRPLFCIIGSVIKAGLVLTHFQERAGQEYQQFPYQQKHDDGKWYSPDDMGVYPSTFSLVAVKANCMAAKG